MIISTLKIRSLKFYKRLEKLCILACKYDIGIICLQDYKIYNKEDDIEHHRMHSDFQLTTSSSIKIDIDTRVGGAGILTSKKTRACLFQKKN